MPQETYLHKVTQFLLDEYGKTYGKTMYDELLTSIKNDPTTASKILSRFIQRNSSAIKRKFLLKNSQISSLTRQLIHNG
ncbi:MAG: hypothetical protein QY314_01645 [Candidatus Dojkabacteria bacterium]|nr:MAG: hypothetical protein QY314_01645 [Candidatus Dojkabacteria bacterium]